MTRQRRPAGSDQRFGIDKEKFGGEDADLTGSQVTEATDKFLPVEGVCSHFHPAHEGHFLVHIDQHVFVDLDVERRGFGLVCMEGIVMKPDGEWLGGGRSLCRLSAVCCRLERAG